MSNSEERVAGYLLDSIVGIMDLAVEELDRLNDREWPLNQGQYVDKAYSHAWGALMLLKSVRSQLNANHEQE